MSVSLPRDIGLHMGEERSWHAESSYYYYTSPTHHSTALGLKFKLATRQSKSTAATRLNQLQAWKQNKRVGLAKSLISAVILGLEALFTPIPCEQLQDHPPIGRVGKPPRLWNSLSKPARVGQKAAQGAHFWTPNSCANILCEFTCSLYAWTNPLYLPNVKLGSDVR